MQRHSHNCRLVVRSDGSVRGQGGHYCGCLEFPPLHDQGLPSSLQAGRSCQGRRYMIMREGFCMYTLCRTLDSLAWRRAMVSSGTWEHAYCFNLVKHPVPLPFELDESSSTVTITDCLCDVVPLFIAYESSFRSSRPLSYQLNSILFLYSCI